MGKGQELLDAAREGDREVVEKIISQIIKRSGPFSLRRGAGVNVQDDNRYTPLHHACLQGHQEIVRLLLSVGASPCIVDKKGATALYLAAWKGDEEIVRLLLNHNNPPVNIDQLTTDQESALLIAAQFGNKEVVAQLLARGADVTIQNKREETALDLAAQYGRLEVVQQILRSKPQLVDRYRFPTCRGQQFPHTPLHRASKNGHEDVVETLIAAGMDANVKTANGTALHEAAYYGKAAVVRVLLASGADLHAADRRGRTVTTLLADFSGEATKRVRNAILDHARRVERQNVSESKYYESEEDLAGYYGHFRPTRSPSDMFDEERKAPETPKSTNIHFNNNPLPSSFVNKSAPSFVKKLASKLNFKAKFSSAPNISNTSGIESEVTINSKNVKCENSNNTNTISIGNSRFFKKAPIKGQSGDICCNDEFDTISLDRVPTLERSSVVNRSNRSCPGFKISLPNITENIELDNSNESLRDFILESENSSNNSTPFVEAINEHKKVSIFEPREALHAATGSAATAINEYYESYEFSAKSEFKDLSEPKPLPRLTMVKSTNTSENVYENVIVETHNTPKPAVRNLNKTDTNGSHVLYENFAPLSDSLKPDASKRTVLPLNDNLRNESVFSHDYSSSRSSTMSSDSYVDKTYLEDIFISKKSKSFQHRQSVRTDSNLSDNNRPSSAMSNSSASTEASALDHVDCSDNNPGYAPMSGTLPRKNPPNLPKKKVLFRHKTFSTIEIINEINRESLKNYSSHWNRELAIETLAHYHIRGTGHCIYEAPTIEEFIYVFNRESLHNDQIEPFIKHPKRDSYFETAICFCRPGLPKFHKSAEDLSEIPDSDRFERAKIDTMKLLNSVEMNTTSFTCFCDDNSCRFHEKKREFPNNLVVKFSAINKSMSTPDITLATTPILKTKVIPSTVEEEPYAVVDIKDIVSRNEIVKSDSLKLNDKSVINSAPSTISTTSGRPYSLKDVSEVLSLKDDISASSTDTSLTFNASSNSLTPTCSQRSSSSFDSNRTSLQSYFSTNSTVASDNSFKSCIEELDSDDETLQSDRESEASDADTVVSDASDTKRPWVHSNSFRYGNNYGNSDESEGLVAGKGSSSEAAGGVASPECGLRAVGRVRSGSGCGLGRRWEEPEEPEGCASEADALSVSSAASSSARHHLAHHHDFSKVSPTPPKKPPRRNLSVSPTHANSPSSGYSYDLRTHARSQDDLDDLQGSKHYLKHGRSVDVGVDGKLSYVEYVEYDEYNQRLAPVPNPRPSLKNRTQPVAITAMYENVVIKEQNPRRKLRRNNLSNQNENFDPQRVRPRKSSAQISSLESLLDDNNSMNSPSESYCEGRRVQVPLSPTHYDQPPTPDHPPPSARQAENSIHERIRPLSQLIMEVIEEIRIRKKSEAEMSES